MVEMTDEQRQVFFQNWYNQWIQPELDRRFGETGVPTNFRIYECLILLPKGQPHIIQFNDEVGWHLESIELAAGKTLIDIGIEGFIQIYDILRIGNVLPPKVNGTRVAFMFLYWDGFESQLFIDFIPNQPDFDPDDERFKFDDRVIAHHLQNKLIERVVKWAKIHQPKLHEVGLWTATPLLLYPLSKIVERVDAGKLDEARKVLVTHCNGDFISKNLVQTWKPIKAFKERFQIFDDALFLHKSQRYHGSISMLIGQIEGVITDWLHEIMPPSDVKWKTKSKIEQFRDALKDIHQFEYAYREALESTVEFLREGEQGAKPFQEFKNWLDKVDPNFPARHALAHGKYIPDLYTEENSIKLFLLLDTICQFMMFYEVRVLNKNLEQNKENGET